MLKQFLAGTTGFLLLAANPSASAMMAAMMMRPTNAEATRNQGFSIPTTLPASKQASYRNQVDKVLKGFDSKLDAMDEDDRLAAVEKILAKLDVILKRKLSANSKYVFSYLEYRLEMKREDIQFSISMNVDNSTNDSDNPTTASLPACGPGTHAEGGVCYPDSRSCVVENGSGIQYWIGAHWIPCSATSCNNGHVRYGGSCVRSLSDCSNPLGGTVANGSSAKVGTVAKSENHGTYSYEVWKSCSNGALGREVSKNPTLSSCEQGYVASGNACVKDSSYPGCDMSDIVLPNGQRWAACNVGATKAYDGQKIEECSGETDCASSLRQTIGSLFQWGRNDDVTSTGWTPTQAPSGTLAGSVGHSEFIYVKPDYVNSDPKKSDWMTQRNDDLWGGSGTTSSRGTFQDRSASGKLAMRGPCASGYHVPTAKEWCDAIVSLFPSSPYACDKYGVVQEERKLFMDTLRLPLTGYRGGSDQDLIPVIKVGGPTFYWSSTPKTEGPYEWPSVGGLHISFYNQKTAVQVASDTARTAGRPVRCLAD